MPSAYIRSLQRAAEGEMASPANSASDLKQRFLEWYNSLPAISRQRLYSMVEFERALSTQGRHLSPILISLGWKRGRDWSATGQYQRYWTPPES